MTIITISTVGFGELRPLSDDGRMFTIVLILLSISNLAYLGTYMVRFIIEGELVEYLKNRRVIKKIQRLENHVIVYGYGRNGEQACLELAGSNQEFVVIENRDSVWPRLLGKSGLLYIKGDPADEEVLKMAQIGRAKAMIMTAPDDANNVFAVLTARELNEKMLIISRAASRSAASKLRRAGADNIIMPERMGGQRMAKLVLQPDIVEFLEYILIQSQNEVIINEVSCSDIADRFVGRHLERIYQANNSGANVIGVKNATKGYIFNPPITYIIDREDHFFVLGSQEQMAEFIETLKGNRGEC